LLIAVQLQLDMSDPARDVAAARPSAAASTALDIHIEEAKAADAPAIAAMGAKTFTEAFGYSVSSADLAAYLQETFTASAVLREVADAHTTTLVARMSEPSEGGTTTGRVVGMVQLLRGKTDPSLSGPADGHALMRRLFVDTSVLGRGIGTRLIAAVEAMASNEAFRQLWLTVFEESSRAQKLYEKLGYTKTGEVECMTGNCIQTDWVMVKRLASI
jgi:diamine N-acetyltransferase